MFLPTTNSWHLPLPCIRFLTNLEMPFKIISLNVNSIVHANKKTLLKNFINENPANIFLLQETKTDNLSRFHFPGFNVLRTDIRRSYAGVAILVKYGIHIKNCFFGRNKLNYVGCEIKLGGT